MEHWTLLQIDMDNVNMENVNRTWTLLQIDMDNVNKTWTLLQIDMDNVNTRHMEHMNTPTNRHE